MAMTAESIQKFFWDKRRGEINRASSVMEKVQMGLPVELALEVWAKKVLDVDDKEAK